MSSDSKRLAQFWRDQGDAFNEALYDDLVSRAGSFYAAIPREELLGSIGQMAQRWQAALEANDPAPLIDFTRQLALQRSESHVAVDDIMHVIDSLREQLWRLMGQLYVAGDWDMDVVEQVERWLHEQRKAVVSSYGQTWQEAQDRLEEREQALQDQSRLIQELSTPIVPIYEGVLVLPLVGAVDSRRATQIMESVLEKIVEYQADVLILDITGVPVVDTGVANYLLQMARAVTLLGARVVLVGIGAEIAQTIVQLGVELRDITTLANLQAGIAYALEQKGYAIRPVAA
jgi:rsbT co-antagonist protein RsbR